MTITLNADYDVTLNTALLGYVGETNARPVSVEGLTVDGADRYVLTIDYGDGTAYEVDITGGQWTPTADILRSAQTVSCQIAAKKLAGNEYILVKKITHIPSENRCGYRRYSYPVTKCGSRRTRPHRRHRQAGTRRYADRRHCCRNSDNNGK